MFAFLFDYEELEYNYIIEKAPDIFKKKKGIQDFFSKSYSDCLQNIKSSWENEIRNQFQRNWFGDFGKRYNCSFD